MSWFHLMILVLVWGAASTSSAWAADSFPRLPEFLVGVNQYSVGPPELEAKHWPLSDADLEYLQAKMGLNVVRFPLWPREIGLDPDVVMAWQEGQVFDEEEANQLPVDWRSLDAVLEQLARHRITPYISPCPERNMYEKLWITLHLPEHARRSFWFTRLVVRHVHEKYGDNVIYGWFENWFWQSYWTDRMGGEFPAEWRRMLSQMYAGSVEAVNRNWQSAYRSFEDVPVPELLKEGQVPEELYSSRRSYDFRLAVDLLHRERLAHFREELRRIAPGAVWAGGCLCNEIGGLYDTMSLCPPRLNGTVRTYAQTSDVVALDTYAPPGPAMSYYRLVAKIAASEGKKFFPVEVDGRSPTAFEALAQVGGPLAGVLVWVGKEDTFGLLKMDGTRLEERIAAVARLHEAFQRDPEKYSTYRPGGIHVYVPEETWNNSVSRLNHVEAFESLCENLAPEELEPVLTDELARLPPGVPIFVLEKNLPRRAIEALNARGEQVVCPHAFFVDEDGRTVRRPQVPKDFFAQLLATEHGAPLLDAFQRVEEKEHNVACQHLGGVVRTSAELAEKNVAHADRPNSLVHLIDGSKWNGMTFADQPQAEVVEVELPQPRLVYGAFVQFFAGDNASAIPPSRLLEAIRISVSPDGQHHTAVAAISGADVKLRSRARFEPCEATHVRFDFGENRGGGSLALIELGVLGKPLPTDG